MVIICLASPLGVPVSPYEEVPRVPKAPLPRLPRVPMGSFPSSHPLARAQWGLKWNPSTVSRRPSSVFVRKAVQASHPERWLLLGARWGGRIMVRSLPLLIIAGGAYFVIKGVGALEDHVAPVAEEPGPYHHVALPGGLRPPMPPADTDAGVEEVRQDPIPHDPVSYPGEDQRPHGSEETWKDPQDLVPNEDKYEDPSLPLFPWRDEPEESIRICIEATMGERLFDPALRTDIEGLVGRYEKAETDEEKLTILEEGRRLGVELITQVVDLIFSREDEIVDGSPLVVSLQTFAFPLLAELETLFRIVENDLRFDSPALSKLASMLGTTYAHILSGKGAIIEAILENPEDFPFFRDRLHQMFDLRPYPARAGGSFRTVFYLKELGDFLLNLFEHLFEKDNLQEEWEAGKLVMRAKLKDPTAAMPDPHDILYQTLMHKLGWKEMSVSFEEEILKIIFDFGDNAVPPDAL